MTYHRKTGNCVQYSSATDKITKFSVPPRNIVTVVNLVIFQIKINIPFHKLSGLLTKIGPCPRDSGQTNDIPRLAELTELL